MCSFLDIEFTKLPLYQTTGSKMGRKSEQKRKAKWVKESKFGQGLDCRDTKEAEQFNSRLIPRLSLGLE